LKSGIILLGWFLGKGEEVRVTIRARCEKCNRTAIWRLTKRASHPTCFR
jgi:hypothetical protein